MKALLQVPSFKKNEEREKYKEENKELGALEVP